MPQSPLSRYRELVDAGSVTEDAAQLEAVRAFDALWKQLQTPNNKGLTQRLRRRPPEPVPGLYVWGSVGRGKTWLMDLSFDSDDDGTGALDMEFGDDSSGGEVIDLGAGEPARLNAADSGEPDEGIRGRPSRGRPRSTTPPPRPSPAVRHGRRVRHHLEATRPFDHQRVPPVPGAGGAVTAADHHPAGGYPGVGADHPTTA